jgi:hypothetical protein
LLHPNINASHSVINASHLIVDGYHRIRNSLHSLVNSMCDLQVFRSGHPSFFFASSISVLPINLFKYFSKYRSVNIVISVQQTLTHSAFLDLPCHDPENRENLCHYLNDYIGHLHGQRHFCIDLETSEKHFNPLENIDKSVLACSSIFSRLRDVGVTMAHAKLSSKIRTERRTPTPVNITVAGEKTCQIDMSVQISDMSMP